MIYRTPQSQIDLYYQNHALNQSSIKVIISDGVESYYQKATALAGQEDLYYEEKEHFLIGSAVDCYLTQGEEYYLNAYHFSNIKKPGDAVLAIVKQVYDSLAMLGGEIGSLNEYQELIYNCCNSNKYYMNRARPNLRDTEANEKLPDDSPKIITWQHDERWKTVVKDGSGYFDDLKEAQGKQVLSNEQNAIINHIIGTFTTHPFTEWLFKDEPNVDIIFQMPLYFEVNGIFCKILPDMIRIDHTMMDIRPLDVKTLGDYVTKFGKHVRRRRYDIQASFYRFGIRKCLGQISELIGKDVGGYNIKNFAFVAESSKYPSDPLIFSVSPALEIVGTSGYIDKYTGEEVYGWTQGIQLFELWSRHSFSVEQLFTENKGILIMDENFNYNIKF